MVYNGGYATTFPWGNAIKIEKESGKSMMSAFPSTVMGAVNVDRSRVSEIQQQRTLQVAATTKRNNLNHPNLLLFLLF